MASKMQKEVKEITVKLLKIGLKESSINHSII